MPDFANDVSGLESASDRVLPAGFESIGVDVQVPVRVVVFASLPQAVNVDVVVPGETRTSCVAEAESVSGEEAGSV